MSEGRIRHKEEIDLDIEGESFSSGASHDSGRSKTNRELRSYKPKRTGRSESWLKNQP